MKIKILLIFFLLIILPQVMSIDYNVMENVTFHPVDTTAYYKVNSSSYYNTSIEINRTCVIIDDNAFIFCNQTGNISITFVSGTTTTTTTSTTLIQAVMFDVSPIFNRTDNQVRNWFANFSKQIFGWIFPYNITHNISIYWNESSSSWSSTIG